jgi:GDP-4-dehydro-6-deoxy-D-mannose reductase
MARPTVVTGAAGFAGGHLLELLASSQVPDIVGWFRPVGDVTREIPGVTWVGVEMLDPQSVSREIARSRPEVIYHLAGAAHVGQSWDRTAQTLQINVMATHHLIEAVRNEVPDARVLITSSALVYGPSDSAITESNPIAPANPYGLSKVAQEMVGTASGGHPLTYIARPFNHFGVRQDPAFVAAAFARQIAEIEAGLLPPELRVGNLEARRDLTDVRDTVRAYRLIVERGTPLRPYNVCSGRAIAVQELLDLLLAKARVNVRVVVDPARYRPNDTPLVLGDPSRVRNELGWTPAISLDQTADDLLHYWRDRVGRG